MTDIKLKEVTINFPCLFTPDPKYGKYQVTLLLPKERPEGQQLFDAVQAMLVDGLGAAEGNKVFNSQKNKDDFCIRCGDKRFEANEKATSEKGCWVIVAKSKTRSFLLVDRDRTPITEAAGNKFTYGAVVNAVIAFGFHKAEKKTYVTLKGLQFVSAGSGTGPSISENAFDVYEPEPMDGVEDLI